MNYMIGWKNTCSHFDPS